MRLLPIVFAALLATMAAAAEGYYADVQFDVQSDGSAQVSGVSNHPLLQPGTTHTLTSKNRERWTFNLTIPERLDEFVIAVTLPQGANLLGISAKSDVAITSHGNRVVIKRVGSNSSVAIVAQYAIEDETAARFSGLTAALLGILVIAVGLVAGFMTARRRRAKPIPKAQRVAEERLALDTAVETLPTRQQDIIALLRAADHHCLTQKQIEDALQLPKSSVSRNVDALHRRGLVRKHQNGMSNLIALHERLDEKPQ